MKGGQARTSRSRAERLASRGSECERTGIYGPAMAIWVDDLHTFFVKSKN